MRNLMVTWWGFIVGYCLFFPGFLENSLSLLFHSFAITCLEEGLFCIEMIRCCVGFLYLMSSLFLGLASSHLLFLLLGSLFPSLLLLGYPLFLSCPFWWSQIALIGFFLKKKNNLVLCPLPPNHLYISFFKIFNSLFHIVCFISDTF